MSDENDGPGTELVPVDTISEVQRIISESDPASMAVSIITVVEWMDNEGSYSMSLMHTPMPPWHLKGLMTFALENWECAAALADYDFDEDEDDFDEEA